MKKTFLNFTAKVVCPCSRVGAQKTREKCFAVNPGLSLQSNRKLVPSQRPTLKKQLTSMTSKLEPRDMVT